ncbi:MAG: PAS domain-containing protein, partial [Planctomycetota bacterium]
MRPGGRDEELAASEAKYRTVVESAGEAIFTCDRKGVFLYMNRVAARHLGGLPQDFVGKTQWEVFPKWLADRQMGQVRRVFDTGQGFAGEAMVVVQGQERLYHTTGVPVRDARGEIKSFLGVARDITELVEIKARLRDSEEKYKRFVDNLPVGVFQSTPDGKVLSGNPALARQYGYATVADYLAVPAEQTWAEPSERKVWVALLERKGTLNDYEVKLKRKDGSYIRVSVSAQGSFDDSGKLVRIDGIEVDVTARRKAEESLRRTGESMRALLNAPNHVMFLMDTQGTVLALNEATAKELGAAPEDILGTRIHDRMSPELARSRRVWELKVIQTGQGQQFEDQHDDTIWEIGLYPVFDDGGVVEAIAVSAVDITERRRAEKALRASEEKYRNLFENA